MSKGKDEFLTEVFEDAYSALKREVSERREQVAYLQDRTKTIEAELREMRAKIGGRTSEAPTAAEIFQRLNFGTITEVRDVFMQIATLTIRDIGEDEAEILIDSIESSGVFSGQREKMERVAGAIKGVFNIRSARPSPKVARELPAAEANGGNKRVAWTDDELLYAVEARARGVKYKQIAREMRLKFGISRTPGALMTAVNKFNTTGSK